MSKFMYIILCSDSNKRVGWGRGNTEAEAMLMCGKSRLNELDDYLVYQVSIGTIITKDMMWEYPVGSLPPKLLKKVIGGKTEIINEENALEEYDKNVFDKKYQKVK